MYQEFTAIFVKACKICEHGGFSQSQSHITYVKYIKKVCIFMAAGSVIFIPSTNLLSSVLQCCRLS